MAIKVLHTSDWHLGKRLFKISRHDEHKAFFSFLLKSLRKECVDLLIISGDIFDSPTPPYESLKLFFDFLHEATSLLKIEIYIIAGNHDSGKLLTSPTPFLADRSIHILGEIPKNPSEVRRVFKKDGETLSIDLIPFFRAYEFMTGPTEERPILNLFEDYMNSLMLLLPKSDYRIGVFHHQVGSYEFAGSEHGLSVSGVNSIPITFFRDYDYLALGHIHRYQVVSKERPLAIYPGSPLPLRFSEANNKRVSLVTFSEGKTTAEHLLIPEYRKLFNVVAQESSLFLKLDEITNTPLNDHIATPLLEVTLITDGPVVGISDKVRDYLKNKRIELVNFKVQINETTSNTEHVVAEPKNIMNDLDQLFNIFYQDKYGTPPSEELLQTFKTTLEEAQILIKRDQHEDL